jgi:uncharacterized membrane protein
MIKVSDIFKSTKSIYILLLVCALIGLTASMALTIEKIAVLKDPTYTPACSINPIVSCNSAMSSAQSEFMGVPISIVGLIAYTALITVSVLLIFGVKLPKEIWAMMVGTALAGLAVILYLIIESIFSLRSICPWCFTLWISVPLVFLGTCAGYSLQSQSKRLSFVEKGVNYVGANAFRIATYWYVLLFFTLLIAFWDFWVSLIP